MKAILLFVLCAISALAADISGKWTGSAEGPNGAMTRSFTFQVNGTKLTGETESEYTGKSSIKDGTITGDDVTFTINVKLQDNDSILTYKGKIVGDQIKLSVQIPALDRTIEYTLKRT